uniref:Mediator of RNA polymerase II transcription subunit 4 n=1 Tax=Parascaris equorum TaxID=6256 RepID=A0A914RKI2_PAREQ
MADGRSLRECLLESVDDLDAVVKQVVFYCSCSARNLLFAVIQQAGIKIKSVRQAEAKKVNSEQVIRFANQISKTYSVAAPLFWRIGDPSRPFPTEDRNCIKPAPRVTAPTTTPALSLLRQPTASAAGILRGTGRGSSLMTPPFSAMQQQQRKIFKVVESKREFCGTVIIAKRSRLTGWFDLAAHERRSE